TSDKPVVAISQNNPAFGARINFSLSKTLYPTVPPIPRLAVDLITSTSSYKRYSSSLRLVLIRAFKPASNRKGFESLEEKNTPKVGLVLNAGSDPVNGNSAPAYTLTPCRYLSERSSVGLVSLGCRDATLP